jgi:NAD+ synthase (glutamine-hydrolysing)
LFGIEICEDVWAPTPPSNHLSLAGADLIFNLSASDELIGKHEYLKTLLAQQSARTISGYIYSGCGFGESTQDVVYGGNALIYENGTLLEESRRFCLDPQMREAQIDVERLRSERRNNTTFVNAQRNIKFDFIESHDDIRIIECKTIDTRDFVLERTLDPYPFIPKSENMDSSCDEIILANMPPK